MVISISNTLLGSHNCLSLRICDRRVHLHDKVVHMKYKCPSQAEVLSASNLQGFIHRPEVSLSDCISVRSHHMKCADLFSSYTDLVEERTKDISFLLIPISCLVLC
jgi:hypothetical protein